jgi:predicted permease
LSCLGQDLRNAVHRLLKAPTYVAFSLLTLSVGIGATTAAFSAVRSVLMPPSDLPALEKVVNLYQRDPRQGGSLRALSFPWLEYEAVRAGGTAFDAIVAHAPFRHAITSTSGTELVWGELVSGNYFDVLDVRPILGRLTHTPDDSPTAPPVAVLSYRLWQKTFGGTTTAIGSLIHINGNIFEVVGVVPRSFRGTHASEVLPTAVWVPLAQGRRLSAPGQQFTLNSGELESRWLLMKARLRWNTTLAEATTQIATITARLDQEHPLESDDDMRHRWASRQRRQWAVIPAASIRLHGQDRFFRPLAGAAMMAVVLVVLIACTNVANLTLARMKRRSQEMVIRAALGASHGQILREQLLESIILSLAGCALGLSVAYALMRIMSREIVVGVGITISIDPVFDMLIVLVAFGTSSLTLALFGLSPALPIVRANLRETLNQDNEVVGPRWSIRKRLIAIQVCISVALFAAAAICALRINEQVRRTNGIDVDRLAMLQMAPPSADADAKEITAIVETVAQLLSKQSNIASVAVASGLPPLTSAPSAHVVQPGGGGFRVQLVASTAKFFTTVGLRAIRGRMFHSSDLEDSEPVAIVSRRFAERLVPSGDALDQRLEYRRTRWAGEEPWPLETVKIVGVVDDIGAEYMNAPQEMILYVPLAQKPERSVTIIARSERNADTVSTSMFKAFRAVSPDLPVTLVGTADEFAAAQMMLPRLGASLMSFLGVAALILAVVGLYGVLTFVVTGRRHEVGIRMALGASENEVIRLILKDGLIPVAVGLGIGLVIAALMWNTAARVLQLRDPTNLRLVVLTLIAATSFTAAYVACRIPAYRATRVTPAGILRHL